MSESEIVAAERAEQNMRPEALRTTASVRAEEYDDGPVRGVSPESWRLQRDIPEPPDPWVRGQIVCDRCSEPHEPYCTHGRQLCAVCAAFCCQTCECEQADARARADEIYEEWHR